MLYLAPLAILLAVCIFRALSAPFSDYAGYYFGSREFLQGHLERAYNIFQLNSDIASQGYKGILVSYAPFPPFTALVFAPFSLIPMGASKLLFNTISSALFLLTLYRTARSFAIPGFYFLLIPILFFVPTVNNIFFGQSYLLLSCLLLEGFIAYRQDKKMLAAAFWSFAILFKVFPAVILLFLLLRRKYKQLFYLSIACALLFGISLCLNGLAIWKYYLLQVTPKLNAGELNDSFTYIFQSAFMLAKKIFLYDELLNPHPVYYSPYLFVAVMAIYKAVLIAAAVTFTLRRKTDDLLSFAIWMTVSMLLSPNGSSYSLVLLVIPVLAMAAGPPLPVREPLEAVEGSVTLRSRSLILALLVLLAACAIPVQRFGSMPVWGQFPRLYFLLLFFCLLIWRSWKADVSRKWLPVALATVLSALFFSLDIARWLPNKDDSSYLLNRETAIFIYGFSAANNRLIYYSWDGAGQRQTVTDFAIDSLNDRDLTIKDNQIWYKGRQLTRSVDQKEKPVLINGSTVLYLSDKHRGIGFYTLRKLPLKEDLK